MDPTSPLEPKDYSARTVQDVVGLSYRQINEWDARGSLPHNRSTTTSWRRFTARDIFTLMVMNEVHARFGIPLKRLDFVRDCMNQPGADHLKAAAELMGLLGVGVWLVTDLEETFFVDSEIEIRKLMKLRYFGEHSQPAYLFVKLNPLVNRYLAALPEPTHLPFHGFGYELEREVAKRFKVKDIGEAKVLDAIRSGDFEKIEVRMEDGEVQTIRRTTRPHSSTRLGQLLEAHDFQNLTVTMRDGRVATIRQEAVERVDSSRLSIRIVGDNPHESGQ